MDVSRSAIASRLRIEEGRDTVCASPQIGRVGCPPRRYATSWSGTTRADGSFRVIDGAL